MLVVLGGGSSSAATHVTLGRAMDRQNGRNPLSARRGTAGSQ
jgi:hypothetical protein